MSNNKNIWWVIPIVLAIFAVGFFITNFNFLIKPFAVFTPEQRVSQLKQEYTTLYSDFADVSNELELKELFYDFNAITIFQTYLNIGSGGVIKTKQKFKGQEIVIFTLGGNGRNVCDIFPNIAGHVQPEENTGLIMRYVPHTFDTSLYDIYRNGFKTGTINVGEGLEIMIKCRGEQPIQLHYLGFKAQFECDISNDEVWVNERYNSRFGLKDLTFTPSKLCYREHPPTLRTSQGEDKIYPDPFPDLNTGEIIPDRELLPDEIISITYATPFVEGVIDPLPPDQVYVCMARDSNNKCSQWAVRQFVEPTNINTFCQIDDDCLKNTKEECREFFDSCQDNICTYNENVLNAPICKNEIAGIIKQRTKLKDRIVIKVPSNNSFIFSQNKNKMSFNFGDARFSANIPTFTCLVNPSDFGDWINPPNPNPQCWKTTISFGNQLIPVSDGQTINIGNNIQITYIASGTYILNPELLTDNKESGFSTNYRKDDWGNTFHLNVVDGIEVQLLDSFKDLFVLKDSNKKIKLRVINNLPRNQDVFVILNQKVKQINLNLEEKRIPITLNQGINDLEIDGFDSSRFDINNIKLEVFYVIEADTKVFIKSNKIIQPYLVTSGECSVSQDCMIPCVGVKASCINNKCQYSGECESEKLDCKDYGCPEGFVCTKVTETDYMCKEESFFQKIINFIKELISKIFK